MIYLIILVLIFLYVCIYVSNTYLHLQDYIKNFKQVILDKVQKKKKSKFERKKVIRWLKLAIIICLLLFLLGIILGKNLVYKEFQKKENTTEIDLCVKYAYFLDIDVTSLVYVDHIVENDTPFGKVFAFEVGIEHVGIKWIEHTDKELLMKIRQQMIDYLYKYRNKKIK